MGWKDAPEVDGGPAAKWMDAPEVTDAKEQSASFADKFVGSMGMRYLQGLASPALAVAQLVGGEGTRSKIAELDAMKQRGMKALGHEGFDWMGLYGSLTPGAGIAKGVTAVLPAAKSIGTRLLQGAVIGGATAASQPSSGVTSEDYFPQKAAQLGMGATIGGIIPGVADLAKGASGIVQKAIDPMTQAGRERILAAFRDRLMANNGQTKQAVINAAEQAKPFLPGSTPTIGEAVSAIPEATGLAAHQKLLSKMQGISPAFKAQEANQAKLISGELSGIAQTPAVVGAAREARNVATAPIRKEALSRANLAAQLLPPMRSDLQQNQDKLKQALLAQQAMQPEKLVSDPRLLKSAVELHAPPSPQPPLETQASLLQKRLLPEQIQKYQAGIQAAKQQMQDVENQGLRELKVKPIIGHIQRMLKDPEIGTSDVAEQSLSAIKEKLARFRDARGVIDANGLYMIRKEIGKTVRKYAQENKDFDQRMTSGLVDTIQSKIDDAIVHSGGTSWPKYLETYSTMSHPIEQMEAGQTLQKALLEPLGKNAQRGAMFAKASDQIEPGTFTTSQSESIGRITKELARRDAYERLARGTSLGGHEATPREVGLPLPNLLSRPAMLANFLMKKAGQSAEEKMAQQAAKEYLNPELFLQSMRQQPVPHRLQPLFDAIMQQGSMVAGTAMGRVTQ